MSEENNTQNKTPWWRNAAAVSIIVTGLLGWLGSVYKTDLSAFIGDATNGVIGLALLVSCIIGIVKAIKKK